MTLAEAKAEAARYHEAFIKANQRISELEEMMSQATTNLRGAAAVGWDAAVAAMRYEDGTPLEIVSMVNPYRPATPGAMSWPWEVGA